ncbi:MAG TPA: class I SAM-dependent methyltransferase [Myxococcota bacterium]|jgi:2-polyprenyl-3-methyl-5-hydroxy-6-metoxy-1,4-benzoquinol methylase
METPNRARTEADERAFFARYYAEQRYHPAGWRLRMERDLRVLLAAAARESGANPAERGSARESGTKLRRVLSIGCGDGAFELLLARHAESVLAVDLSPEAIAVAQRAQGLAGVRNVEFRCMSFRDLPWEERFDAIVCLAFLHHVSEPELPGFLRACHDHLAPGGLFFSQDPNVRGVLRAIGRVVLGKRYDAYHSPDERELDPDETLAQLRAAGLVEIGLRHVDLTLIPACYVIRRGPALPLQLLAWLDRAWCATPLAPFSSGFAAWGRRAR